MKLFTDNPLIERYRYSSLRPKQCWIYGSIFVTIVALMLVLNFAMLVEGGAYQSFGELLTSLYYQFFVLLFLVLCISSASSTSTALRDEAAERSYDFFRMLPLSAHYKAVGILIGRNLLILIIGGVLAIAAAIPGAFGGVPLLLICQMMFCVAAVAIFFNFLGLFSSINYSRKASPKQAQTSGAVIVILLAIPCMIIAMIVFSNDVPVENLLMPFFNIKIPVLVLIALLALYLSAWIYLGICRKFDKESEPVMTKPGALLFSVGAMFVLLGLLGPYMLGPDPAFAVAAYWAASFLVITLLPQGFGLMRQRYMEVRSLNSALTAPEFLFKHSNLSVCAVLFALWAVPALCTGCLVLGLLNAMVYALTLFTFYSFFCLLMELRATSDPSNQRLKVLLAFIAILSIFLPFIFGAVFFSGGVVAFSIIGYFTIIFGDPQPSGSPEALYVLPVNICFVALLWVFVKQSYSLLFPAKEG